MSAISDIRHWHLLFQYQNKCVGMKAVILITKGSRYLHQSPFWCPIFIYFIFKLTVFEPTPLDFIVKSITIQLQCLSIGSDILYKFIPIYDKMLNSAPSVRYWRFQYQAQSDMADHRYRTKCPPMHKTRLIRNLPPIKNYQDVKCTKHR